MKFNILLLFGLLSALTYAQSGKKLLPVLIVSDNDITKMELSYDNQNRLTRLQSYTRSPFDSTFIQVIRKEINYENDPLILLNSSTRINNSLLVDSLYSKIHYNNNNIRVEVPHDYQNYLTLDSLGRLISTEYIKPESRNSTKYRYDKQNNVSRIEMKTTFTTPLLNCKEITMIHDALYPANKNYKTVFENVNSPEWLICHLFSFAYPYFNNATQMRVRMIHSYYYDDEITEETDKLEYTYNADGYPITVFDKSEKDYNKSVLRIYYIDAK